MNPLRRPAAAARREPSPGGEINGSAASDLDPGVWSGDGSGSRAEQPRGGEAAGAAAPHGVAGAGGIGLQMAWPGGAPPSPSVLASLLPGGSASGVTAGVVPGGTAMADGGNVLDWWSSRASGQLGPEWLAAVLAAAGATASTSNRNHSPAGQAEVAEVIPARGGPARRRGGRGGGGRGGRAPRPPAPVRAAPASVNVETADAMVKPFCQTFFKTDSAPPVNPLHQRIQSRSCFRRSRSPAKQALSSSRSILDEFLRQEKPLVQRTKDQITDYCTTIEGDECCSCWDAYFELNKLEQELPKDEIARMVKDSEGDVKYLIDSIHHRSNLRKKMAEKARDTVSSRSQGQTAKPRPFPVPDGLPKTQEELAEEEEALMPESSYTKLLRRMGRYPDWYTPRPDHETD